MRQVVRAWKVQGLGGLSASETQSLAAIGRDFSDSWQLVLENQALREAFGDTQKRRLKCEDIHDRFLAAAGLMFMNHLPRLEVDGAGG